MSHSTEATERTATVGEADGVAEAGVESPETAEPAAGAAAPARPAAGDAGAEPVTVGGADEAAAPAVTPDGAAVSASEPAGDAAGGYATVRYTLARFGVFVASFVVIAALAYVGVLPESFGAANPLWIALLAIIVSAPISYVVLRRQRDAMSQQIAPRIEQARGRLRANQSMEDDAA
ncbi:DUF4229 domain-containing protein [Streptomyces sp. NPDC127098]|uniref:DUF4229 domain-containing protein n=1 Tax=Streptomyces sp. NPDC127098 TaxID=3347137 RepID=UPI00364BA21B